MTEILQCAVKHYLINQSIIIRLLFVSFSGPENSFTQGFLGFSVYVSNTTDRSAGTLCYKDTNFTVHTIPPVINIPCIQYAQYVIYFNQRLGEYTDRGYSEYAFNDICEIEVFGDFYFFYLILNPAEFF